MSILRGLHKPVSGSFSGPAELALARTILRFAIALRCGGVAAAGIAAAIGEGTGISRSWQASVLGGLAVWAVLFTLAATRRGLTFPLVAADSAVVSLALLAQGHYIPVAAVADETTWAIMLASTAVYVAQLTLRPSAALPLAAVVVVAYTVSAPAATTEPRVLIVQTIAVSVIMELLRSGGRRADALVAERDLERRRIVIEAARRADEREQRSQLHDSVLATLTMVASGAVEPGSASLRTAAERSVAIMEGRVGLPSASAAPPVDLAERLRAEVGDPYRRLRVHLTAPAPEIRSPEAVATAITGAVGEALRNAERHAGVREARVRVEGRGDGVLVEISDRGRGFDPARVPDSRHGIRESIAGRMAAIGGTAAVHSAPGKGTRIVLRWPSD